MGPGAVAPQGPDVGALVITAVYVALLVSGVVAALWLTLGAKR